MSNEVDAILVKGLVMKYAIDEQDARAILSRLHARGFTVKTAQALIETAMVHNISEFILVDVFCMKYITSHDSIWWFNYVDNQRPINKLRNAWRRLWA